MWLLSFRTKDWTCMLHTGSKGLITGPPGKSSRLYSFISLFPFETIPPLQKFPQPLYVCMCLRDFPAGVSGKESACQCKRRKTQVQSLGMATHSSILVWKIPWTEEPGGLLSIGSQRVEHGWSDLAWHTYFYRNLLVYPMCNVRIYTDIQRHTKT